MSILSKKDSKKIKEGFSASSFSPMAIAAMVFIGVPLLVFGYIYLRKLLKLDRY